MSLLLNEDFTLYQLRLGYLQNINDGVGERLISLDPSVLANPAFRAAGFVPDTGAVKRCYSPPIPTTGAADYFTRPARSRQGRRLADGSDPEEGGGLLTGRTSEDTLGPTAINEKEKRRRKQRERMEEDDSSDLSDDSDEEEEETAAQGVRFEKLSRRKDSSASPPQTIERKPKGGPEVHVISPSYRPRTSSLSDAVRNGKMAVGRPRGDTITSSEFSSDGDLEAGAAAAFKRKLPSRPGNAAMLADKIAEEDSELEGETDDVDQELDEEEDDVEVAEASDLSDEFEGDDVAVPSPELLGVADATTASSPRKGGPPRYGQGAEQNESNDSNEAVLPLPGLPAGHTVIQQSGSSLLTSALRGGVSAAPEGKPFQQFAELYGKEETSPLWIKIYCPFSKRSKPLEVPMKRQPLTRRDGPLKVKDLVGLALYRYHEEALEPKLAAKDLKIENWELRMVDDGEVEMDFPALNSDRPIADFTSNNSRPPQRRARDKPWDEFGLVRASSDEDDEEVEEEKVPVPVQTAPQEAIRSPISQPTTPLGPPSMLPSRNRITGPSFHLLRPAERKESTNLLDAPAMPTATFTPRTGDAKNITVHYTDPQSFNTTKLAIDTTADTYIADIFDTACARLALDKALYVLKVRGTQTVAPADRTVEALGANLHLDLARRRFGGVGDFGLSAAGSPGSTSPNAPLELVPNTPPIGRDGRKRKGFNMAAQVPTLQQHGKGHETITTSALNYPGGLTGRRYNVLRKMPLSFSASHPRTLIITPEFLQIMGIQPEDGHPSGKVTNIHMSSVIGAKVSRKHPKMARVVVYREKEAKRYDFECASNTEAEAIVADVRVGMDEYGGGLE